MLDRIAPNYRPKVTPWQGVPQPVSCSVQAAPTGARCCRDAPPRRFHAAWFDTRGTERMVGSTGALGRGVGHRHGGDSWMLEGTPPCLFFSFPRLPGRGDTDVRRNHIIKSPGIEALRLCRSSQPRSVPAARHRDRHVTVHRGLSPLRGARMARGTVPCFRSGPYSRGGRFGRKTGQSPTVP